MECKGLWGPTARPQAGTKRHRGMARRRIQRESSDDEPVDELVPVKRPQAAGPSAERAGSAKRAKVGSPKTADGEINEEGADCDDDGRVELDAVSGEGTGRASDEAGDVDCGFVYTQARCATEAAFVRGAGRVARPYQSDAVAKLLSLIWIDRKTAESRPVNYLVQHATGTGKSLTIASLALALLSFRKDGAFEESGANTEREPQADDVFFSLVIVLTDRLQLDRQLGDTVESMLNAHGIDLLRCTSSNELLGALESPAQSRPRAVLSTLQKFAGLAKLHAHHEAAASDAGGSSDAKVPRTLDMLLGGGLANGRVALIADEAHRSHGSATSLAINQVLGGRGGQSPLMTYIGFSATPSPAALRLFGVNRRGPNGPEFAPAHCYSMQAAIRDGYVCSVRFCALRFLLGRLAHGSLAAVCLSSLFLMARPLSLARALPRTLSRGRARALSLLP